MESTPTPAAAAAAAAAAGATTTATTAAAASGTTGLVGDQHDPEIPRHLVLLPTDSEEARFFFLLVEDGGLP